MRKKKEVLVRRFFSGLTVATLALGVIFTPVIAKENAIPKFSSSNLQKVAVLISTEYQWKNLDSEGKDRIREIFGNEWEKGLALSLEKIGESGLSGKEGRNQYRVYLACMATFEEETLLYYKNIITKKELSLREKKALLALGYWVSDPKSFCFVIDRFLGDKETLPYKKLSSEGMLGKSLRYCDRVMALAQYRVEGTRDWSVHDVVVPLVKIKHRDADLVLFKKWWAENKANLKWSEEKKKFYVDPTLEKGTGILNVKRHRNREQLTEKPHKK